MPADRAPLRALGRRSDLGYGSRFRGSPPYDMPPPRSRVFLLSPAHSGGKRAGLLLREAARFPLAERLRSPGGATLGETFSFLSGLYFRGKLAYAREFARPPAGEPGARVITTSRGLVDVDARVRAADLREFASVEIRPDEPRYREPLERDLARLGGQPGVEIVLLGSVATGKYVDVLLDVVGERLLFPIDFVGRGDMSRGALLLRAARERVELPYEPVATALRRGPRPRKAGPANDRDQSRADARRDPDPG